MRAGIRQGQIRQKVTLHPTCKSQPLADNMPLTLKKLKLRDYKKGKINKKSYEETKLWKKILHLEKEGDIYIYVYLDL